MGTSLARGEHKSPEPALRTASHSPNVSWCHPTASINSCKRTCPWSVLPIINIGNCYYCTWGRLTCPFILAEVYTQTKEKYTTCAIPLPLLFVPYMSPLSGSGFPSKNPGPCEHHISRDQCQIFQLPPQITDNRNIPGGGKGGGRKPSGLGALHWLHSVLQAKFWFPQPLE